MTLDEARRAVGRVVVYRPYTGGQPEEGVITSVNDRYVFVRYSATALNGTATPPERLELQ